MRPGPFVSYTGSKKPPGDAAGACWPAAGAPNLSEDGRRSGGDTSGTAWTAARGRRQHLPFARQWKQTDGSIVSGQIAMVKGEVVGGGIAAQAARRFRTCSRFRRSGDNASTWCAARWLGDPRDFAAFNAVFKELFRRASAGPLLRGFEHGGGIANVEIRLRGYSRQKAERFSFYRMGRLNRRGERRRL